MNADDLIQSYVDDVARLLPRKQRRDVAAELRTLLTEELAARAAETGRAADEGMARDLVLAFGRPAEAAARYHPVMTLIDSADSRRFLRLTLIGVAVIWGFGLVDVMLRHPVDSVLDVLDVLRRWWLGAGLAVLWWPGLLVVCFAAAAWLRRHRPEPTAWKPRPMDRERVNRAGHVAGIVAAVCGLLVLFNAGRLLDHFYDGRAAAHAYQVFALDDDFLSRRAPWLLSLMVLHLALYVVLIVRGRWQRLTRRIDLGLTLAVCGALAWALLGGAVFEAGPTDQIVKGVSVLIILGALADVGLKIRRELRRASYLPST
ncbi:hypothetical protein [Nonomuraea sp. NPDC050643]|uniref:hypothetical protein n=1 Tax=Nonomuraea sp. NPDC050643 TaxID=3155660 RepID=UPI0033E9B99F